MAPNDICLWLLNISGVQPVDILGAPGLDAVLQMGLTRAKQRGTITSLALLATPLLMEPRILLAFQAASAHCWLMSSFLSTRTPKSFSARLLSRTSSPSFYKYLGLPQPKCSTLHLALLNLIRFS